jgi:hypothetical protein
MTGRDVRSELTGDAELIVVGVDEDDEISHISPSVGVTPFAPRSS